MAHPASFGASAPETLSTAQPAVREFKVSVSTGFFSYWEYEGTRAQLEAEGVIPPGTAWPQGKDSCCWESGRLTYWLRRIRPEGLKGPMAVWTTGDWWCLRCDDKDAPDFPTRRILHKARDLADEIHRLTPSGKREWEARWNLHWAARQDKAFQAFKSTFIPARKKPRRSAKATTITSTQGAQA